LGQYLAEQERAAFHFLTATYVIRTTFSTTISAAGSAERGIGMTETSEFTVALKFTRLCCSECGVPWGVPEGYERNRRDDHKTFWCPNGHAQHFPQESEAERLRKSLHAATLARESAERRAREAAEARESAEKDAKRLKARAKAGVCPCCNRTFKQLAAHMKNKHPEIRA
jgi:hypothetical protein